MDNVVNINAREGGRQHHRDGPPRWVQAIAGKEGVGRVEVTWELEDGDIVREALDKARSEVRMLFILVHGDEPEQAWSSTLLVKP